MYRIYTRTINVPYPGALRDFLDLKFFIFAVACVSGGGEEGQTGGEEGAEGIAEQL